MKILDKKIINEATKKLIAIKKKSGFFNVSIDYKGATWSMAITAYDNKPFPKKEVYITIHSTGGDCFISKVVKIVTPKYAGYTLKQFKEYHPRMYQSLPA